MSKAPCIELVATAFACGTICVAFLGYGLVLREIGREQGQGPLCQSMALGFSVCMGLLGWVELFNCASKALFWGILLVGALLALRLWRPNRAGCTKWPLGWATASFLIFLVWNLSDWHYHALDDSQGYLVMVQRILQLGGLGQDPFFVRRAEVGLGAGNYFNALFVSVGPLRQLAVFEPFVTLVMLACACADAAAARRLAPWTATVLQVTTAAALAAYPGANIAPQMVATPLLVVLLELFFASLQARRVSGVDVCRGAALLATLIALKATCLLFAAALLILCLTTGVLRSASPRALAAGMLLGLLFLAPWMLASWQNTGTALYPVLGTGYVDSAALSGITWRWWAIHSVVQIPWMGACALMAAFPRGLALAPRRLSCGLVLLVTLTLPMMAALLSANYLAYAFPLALSAWWVLASRAGVGRSPAAHAGIVSVGCVAFCLFIGLYQPYWRKGLIFGPPTQNFFGFQSGEAERLRQAQKNIPAGSTLVARVRYPYLLDFRRNVVDVMDWPGSIKGCDGCDDAGSMNQFVGTLRQRGVGYVLYDYASGANHPEQSADEESRQQASRWVASLAQKTHAVQRKLRQLPAYRHKVYDDGQSFILDLATPAEQDL